MKIIHTDSRVFQHGMQSIQHHTSSIYFYTEFYLALYFIVIHLFINKIVLVFLRVQLFGCFVVLATGNVFFYSQIHTLSICIFDSNTFKWIDRFIFLKATATTTTTTNQLQIWTISLCLIKITIKFCCVSVFLRQLTLNIC